MTVLILYLVGCVLAMVLLYKVLDMDNGYSPSTLVVFYIGILGSWVTISALFGYFITRK